jgi:hypothetical protein
MKNRIDFRRVFLLAGLVALVMVYAILWVKTLSDPALRTGSDFIAFYSAGRIARSGDLAAVFDPGAQRLVEQDVLGFEIRPEDLNPFVHPPFIVPVLALVAGFDYVTAFHLWGLFLGILCVASAWVLGGLFPAPEQRGRVVLAAGFLTFFPLYVSIVNGQDSALLLFGAVLWLLGLRRRDDRLAGLGLALTTIRPQLALALALPFIFRQRKVWWWFCAGAGVLVLISVLLVGPAGVANFLRILSISAGGEGYKIHESAMVNLIGLLVRTVPALPAQAIRVVGWAGFAILVPLLCVIWWKSPVIEEKHVGLAVVLALFLSPHLHYHDLAMLLLPLGGAMRVLSARRLAEMKDIVLVPVSLSLVLLFGFFVPAIQSFLPYLVMLALVLFLWMPEKVIFWKRPRQDGPIP